jgi:glycosyltransferase involved in cell wall biosynthesis
VKILQIIDFFYPAWGRGGPPRSVYELSKELVKKGHEVTVYTTDIYKKNQRMNNIKNPILLDGINVYYFKNISNKLAWSNYSFSIDLMFAMNNNISSFDIVHAHLFRSMHAVALHHFAQRKKIPYILQPRGSAPRWTKSQIKYIFDAVFGNHILNDARKIIVSSEIESTQYYDLFPFLNKKVFSYMPNGIDLSVYNKLPPKGNLKNKYNIKSNEKIILYLGLIDKRKNIGLLIQAFSKIVSEFSDIKLVIVGPDYGHLDYLIKLSDTLEVKDNVIFTGPLYDEDKLQAYVDADIFVLPSKYESFGNVVIEACACGTPTIVSNGCGASEWLNTIITTNPTRLGLYRALKKLLLLSDNEREMLGFKSQTEIKKLSIRNVTKDAENIYYNMLRDI